MAEFKGKIYKIEQLKPAADFIYKTIAKKLDAGSVLWLLCGGSSVSLEVRAAERLANHYQLNRLTVGLIDERYGPPGHPESNWQKLLAAGFSLDGANLNPVLKGRNLLDTVTDFNQFLEKCLERVDYSIGIPGLGADGHTAGVLPNSPALDDKHWATSYSAADFTRLTITPKGLAKLDEIILYAVGPDKEIQLKRLIDQDLDVSLQPAQVVKKVPRLTIFNDLIGEDL